jgi:hypothetical protein
LTEMKDRLYALQGLVDVMGKLKKDHYYFGLWSASIPSQLLWLCTKEVKSTSAVLPQVPSWSWMSTEGPIRFWRKEILINAGSSICKDVTITDSGFLQMRCWMDKLEELQPYTLENWDPNDNFGESSPDRYSARIKRLHLELLPVRPLYNVIVGDIPCGLAAFDSGCAPTETVYCACLMSEDEDKDGIFPVIDILLLREGEDGHFYRLGVGLLFAYGPGPGYSTFRGTFRSIEIH